MGITVNEMAEILEKLKKEGRGNFKIVAMADDFGLYLVGSNYTFDPKRKEVTFL